MKKTVLIVTILVLALTVLITGCASGSASPSTAASSSPSSSSAAASGDKIFTLDELSKYDGKNGNPAYVAANGIVYDVTNVPQWSNGLHHGFTAGKDLTEALNGEPHNAAMLNNVPIVGKLQ